MPAIKTTTTSDLLSQRTENGKAARAFLAGALVDAVCENGLATRLYYRWQDEKKFEDINDYGKALAAPACKAINGAKLVSANKKPFGATFSVPGMPYDIRLEIRASGIGWAAVNRPV